MNRLNSKGDIMVLDDKGYKVSHPSQLPTLISIGFSTALIIYSLIKSNDYTHFLSYFSYIAITICLTGMGLTLYRSFKKPFKIKLHRESLFLNGMTIKAENIKAIYIMGYFKPVIGIKTTGEFMVPFKLSFRYLEEEIQGITAIKAWAKENQIKVTLQGFMTK
ncbi:hypothetical protein [Paenibacillus luteus]|uniref:hypothetical protein n=1 Tax=Paenibacillus luteus TaxID=2545753 RepID=UPI0019D6456E|nr:hypothetical protein [Paenibacillus luteus]